MLPLKVQAVVRIHLGMNIEPKMIWVNRRALCLVLYRLEVLFNQDGYRIGGGTELTIPRLPSGNASIHYRFESYRLGFRK